MMHFCHGCSERLSLYMALPFVWIGAEGGSGARHQDAAVRCALGGAINRTGSVKNIRPSEKVKRQLIRENKLVVKKNNRAVGWGFERG